MQKNGEIPKLLGYFMRHHGQAGDHAQMDIGKKRRGDEHPIHQIVYTVAHQYQIAGGGCAAMFHIGCMGFAFMGMAMAPQHHLLQHEKRQQAGQHRRHDGMAVSALCLQGVWQ